MATAAQFPGQGGTVQFSEGVDVGYRGFEASGQTPLFPFGFGLSYTSFSYTSPSVEVASVGGHPVVSASVKVTNTGHRSGADVAQLYLGQPASADEPSRQLEAFARVALAPASRSGCASRSESDQLGYYATGSHRFEVAAGRYRISMGDSSALAGLPVTAGFALSHPTTLPPG